VKYGWLVWRNLWRRRTRTLLTILSVFVAFALFGLLSAIDRAFNAGSDVANVDRLMVINKISIIQPLPISYYERIRSLPGVQEVTHANWFGGYYQEPRNPFPQFPVDAASYLKIYPEIELLPEQVRAWLDNRVGAIVGRTLAERYGWRLGDRLPIQATIYPQQDGNRTWEFEIEGIFTSRDPAANDVVMLFHYDYFDEARQFGQGQVGWYILRVTDPARAAEVARTIDEMFANSPAETKTSTERAFAESFAKQFGDIGLIITGILTAVFFTILLVAGNTMAQSVRERIPELAVLKTIGFGDGTVLAMVLAEALLIVLIGGALGLGLAGILISGVAKTFATVLPGIILPSDSILLGVLYMVLVGLAAGLLPALEAWRLTIVQALGRR